MSWFAERRGLFAVFHESTANVAGALKDPDNEVWKLALDGLVILCSPESRKVLEAELERAVDRDSEYRAWIEEAIGQIDEVIGKQPND